VAILTVVVVPPLMAALARRAPPSPEERARLDREAALQRSYLAGVERALVPVLPRLLPESAARVLESLAVAKSGEGEFFDITELTVGESGSDGPRRPERVAREVQRVDAVLSPAGEKEETELLREEVRSDLADPVEAILTAARSYDLLALGAPRPQTAGAFSLGELQDRIVDQAKPDVLVAVMGSPLPIRRLRRILVPVNGLPPSYAAGEVAAYLARTSGAKLILFSVVAPGADVASIDHADREALRRSSRGMLDELRFRIGRLGVRVSAHVELADDSTEAILHELGRRPYDLVVLGTVDRSGDDRLLLGSSIPAVLARSPVPALLLVMHEDSTAVGPG
jgi:nucleotide-binding universal stress UspA family protein